MLFTFHLNANCAALHKYSLQVEFAPWWVIVPSGHALVSYAGGSSEPPTHFSALDSFFTHVDLNTSMLTKAVTELGIVV